MKHKLIGAVLSLSVLLGGCAASSVYRGVDASTGNFVSTHSPKVSVVSGKEYRSVLSASTLCSVPFENSTMNFIPSRVWFSLKEKEGAQLVSLLAECPSEYLWEVRGIGVDYQLLKVFYERNGEMPSDATLRVYVRPASMDPWMPLFAGEGKSAWEGSSLVARYEWMSSADNEKLMVEYREPAPEILEGMNPKLTELSAFIERSKEAFSLSEVPENIAPSEKRGVQISDSLLAPVVGSVTVNHPLLF